MDAPPRDRQPRFGDLSGAADPLGSKEQGAGCPRAELKWLVCFCRDFPVSPKMGLHRTLPDESQARWPSPGVQGAGHCPARREGRGSDREAQAGLLLSHHFAWIPPRDSPEPRTWPWGLEETGRQAGARPQVVRVLRGRPPLPSASPPTAPSGPRPVPWGRPWMFLTEALPPTGMTSQ